MKRIFALLCAVSLSLVALAQNFDELNPQESGRDAVLNGLREEGFGGPRERREPKSVLVDETYPSGDRYVGYKKGDMNHGQGIYYWADGSRYEGEFSKSDLCGFGTLYKANGTKFFEGEFKNNQPHGVGTLYFSNGRRYVGEWENGVESGSGILYGADNRVIYGGYWKNGQPNGTGTYYWDDGRKYVGEFLNGKSHGKGTLYNADGSVFYTGEWQNDQPAK